MGTPTLCFRCGQPITSPLRLHQLPDGEPCPACRERALDLVPPALPTIWPAFAAEEPEESGFLQADLPFDPGDLGDDFPEPA